MNLDRVDCGRKLPDEFNVIIEIPMNADPVKYEVDKATGALLRCWDSGRYARAVLSGRPALPLRVPHAPCHWSD